MYYLDSKTKGGDQRGGYGIAYLQFCFGICKQQVYSKCGLSFKPGKTRNKPDLLQRLVRAIITLVGLRDITVKFLNFRTPEIFAVINLKLIQYKDQTLEYYSKKM